MKAIARSLVSQNKRRYRDHGFDLDLSYITPRIIAMAFPSNGLEGFYRHSRKEIMDFLTKFHHQKFKIFHLCSERDYDDAELGGNVQRIPFDDHCPAPLNLIQLFCQSAFQWLSSDPENVVVVHCKAGKGRTGLMVCALLIYTDEFQTAESAFSYYGPYHSQPKTLSALFSRYAPEWNQATTRVASFQNSYKRLQWISSNNNTGHHEVEAILTSMEQRCIVSCLKEADCITYDVLNVSLIGDIRVDVFRIESNKEARLFYLWFNTSYVETDRFFLDSRQELDKPSKSLRPDTQVELIFSAQRFS